ncbi:alanine--tRNA ligase-related protein [Bartonella phoceensis]|uniref:alanine--tRNA ligase-related protein n=1 Tax=Bartonella phoceensis TaxID=270249 RepID=UPI001ABAFDCD|nr:alanine--tRNA ligase-related protein [Bartonella phoceensis]
MPQQINGEHIATKTLYLEDTHEFHFKDLIQEAEKDDKGIFIILDQTAFYPQGGGQSSDHGVIRNDHFKAHVIHITKYGDKIKHYTEFTTTKTLAAQKLYDILDKESS